MTRNVGDQIPGLTLWRGCVRGEFTSSEYVVAPFDRAVLSWNASGPCICELEAQGVRHCMGKWGKKPRSQATDSVAVDTLVLKKPARSFRFCIVPERGAAVTLVAVAHWKADERRRAAILPDCGCRNPGGLRHSRRAWGTVLPVPERSQFTEKRDARRLCSPTALAMVLEYHGVRKGTREAAKGVYDHAAGIYGNWPFNTAYAHSVSGFETFVQRGKGLANLEDEIAAGRPVIISHTWKKGDLDGAPLPQSDGHLIVIVGFTPNGAVVVNDPAGEPGAVRRVYRRRQVERTWLERGSGIMYVLRRRAD